MFNKKLSVIFFIVVISLLFFKITHAQQGAVQNYPDVNYKGQPAVDSDSDGLTDEGEKQIYKTDPNKADTDGDKYDDGVEVLAGTNPLDPNSYPGMQIQASQISTPVQEIPWAWYFARTAGLVGFLLLYVSIFLGLSLRVPLLRKIISPVYSMSVHCWISLYAFLFALFHGVVLIFDKTINFTLIDVFVPFAAKYQPGLVALGIFSLYLMVILIVTSYGRKFISQKMWRLTHFSNIVLYVITLVHATKLGTDMKNPIVFEIFLWMNAFLIFIMLYNIELRIADAMKRKTDVAIQ